MERGSACKRHDRSDEGRYDGRYKGMWCYTVKQPQRLPAAEPRGTAKQLSVSVRSCLAEKERH